MVKNGKSAIRRASAIRPEALITDVIMPGMNGVDAAIEISELDVLQLQGAVW